jgi:hypothetical protein
MRQDGKEEKDNLGGTRAGRQQGTIKRVQMRRKRSEIWRKEAHGR